MKQGDVYWGRAVDKRRPLMIISRSTAIPVLNRLVVAPITTKIRGIPQEISIPGSVGLHHDCVASMDNVFSMPKQMLGDRVGAVPDARHQICRALEAVADC